MLSLLATLSNPFVRFRGTYHNDIYFSCSTPFTFDGIIRVPFEYLCISALSITYDLVVTVVFTLLVYRAFDQIASWILIEFERASYTD